VEVLKKMPSPLLFISLKRDNEILALRIPSLRLHLLGFPDGEIST
jgi:hypothetical protein